MVLKKENETKKIKLSIGDDETKKNLLIREIANRPKIFRRPKYL